MHAKVVRSGHAFMHHEDSRLDHSAFTWLQDHRTDGQFRRSAPLQHFDIWLLFEAQCTITAVGDLDGKLACLTEFNIAIINLILIDSNGWCAATCRIVSCEQDCSEEQHSTSQNGQKPWEILSFLFPILLILFRHPTSLLFIIKLERVEIRNQVPDLFFCKNGAPHRHTSSHATAQDLALQQSRSCSQHPLGISKVCWSLPHTLHRTTHALHGCLCGCSKIIGKYTVATSG